MKQHRVTSGKANTPEVDRSELVEKIYDLIEWYEANSTRKEDDYICANLKLIIHLAENVESSEDIMFIEKISDTFLDIIKRQREVISQLEYDADCQPLYADFRYDYMPYGASADREFTRDEQVKSIFYEYMINGQGMSSYTVNDYTLRIQNLWRSFYSEYERGELPKEMMESINADEINAQTPLINAYKYIEELNCYVSMKIAADSENRNWANVRASLNKFGKAMHGEEYKNLKSKSKPALRKDFSKYSFDDRTLGKSRLVLAVVKRYVADHRPHDLDELEKAFPSSLQGSLGVVRRIEDVSDKYRGVGGVKRYFVADDEMIRLSSGECVIVCTQWGTNIEQFVEHATRVHGYKIEKV